MSRSAPYAAQVTTFGMDLPVNRFKRAIAAVPPAIGTWLSSGSPATAEAMGCAGFDFLVVDCEHTPLDPPQLVDVLRAVATTPAAALVRPPWNDVVMIKRALDAGANSVLLPYVQSAEEAARAVASTRYPPEGVRGVAGMHRGSRFGTVADYLKVANREMCVVVQIETIGALRQLEAIAAVPGVDSVFIGPNDLAASMGFTGDIEHRDVQAEIEGAARTCRREGRACGILGATTEAALRYLRYGFSWVAVASDMAFMMARAKEVLVRVREQARSRA